MKTIGRWTLLGMVMLGMAAWPFMVRADELKIQYDGASHSVTVPYEDLWRLLKAPDVIWMPPDTASVSARSAGTVWTIMPDGSVYADGQPVVSPAGMTWVALGKDFESVTLTKASVCRYGVPGHYADLPSVKAGVYVILPATFGVADPALGVVKSFECQQAGTAKAAQLTLIGRETYGKFAGAWLRYDGHEWVDASSTPAELLNKP